MATLTGKAASELPEAGSLGNDELFVISQNGASKKLPASVLRATLKVIDGAFRANDGNVVLTTAGIVDGTRPSAVVYGKGVLLYDSQNNTIGRFYPVFQADGRQGVGIQASRQIGGDTVANAIGLYINASGEMSVALSSSSAWRKALGLNYAAGNTFSPAAYIIAQGIATSTTDIAFTVITDKSLEDISGITITTLTGGLRNSSGFLDGKNSLNAQILDDPNYTVTALKLTNNQFRVMLTKNAAITGMTASDQITFHGSITATFT